MSHRGVWTDTRSCAVLGMGQALPGAAITTPRLLAIMQQQFGVDVQRTGNVIAQRLGIQSRHVCRDFIERHERPRAADSNAALAARAVRSALQDAGLQVTDLSYLIGHTATPGQSLPPNIAQVAELLNYAGPFMELRQACTGFANALITARGLLDSPQAGPIAIVGSETGSVYFDPQRAIEDHGQLVNLLQMGDAAAACVIGGKEASNSATLSHLYFGQCGGGRPSGFKLAAGSDCSPAARGAAEFAHDFAAVRAYGPELFERGVASAQAMGIEIAQLDYVIPHQANGRMAELLAPRLGIDTQRVFVNAQRCGNTGSAAIWLALSELRPQLTPGARVLVLGAEATQHMFGGFLYVHA